jgi:hypothetical protein
VARVEAALRRMCGAACGVSWTAGERCSRMRFCPNRSAHRGALGRRQAARCSAISSPLLRCGAGFLAGARGRCLFGLRRLSDGRIPSRQRYGRGRRGVAIALAQWWSLGIISILRDAGARRVMLEHMARQLVGSNVESSVTVEGALSARCLLEPPRGLRPSIRLLSPALEAGT